MKARGLARLRPAPRPHTEAPERDPGAIAERLLGVTVGLSIAAAAAIVFGGIANHLLLDGAISDLSPELEGNLPSWIGVVASFAGALAAALHALILPDRRRSFFVLAATLGFISVDEGIRFHERVGETVGLFENVETVILAPVYAVVFLIIWAYGGEVFKRARTLLRLGLILLVAAVTADLGSGLTSSLEEQGTVWPHVIRLSLEEGLEVSGWILISGTLTTLLCVALVSPAGIRASGRHRATPNSFG